MTIIIQSNAYGSFKEFPNIPHHFDVACALYGAIDSAENFRLTSFEEIQSGKLNLLLKRNLAVGSVEFMFEVFRQLGKEIPKLPRNSNRDCEHITLEVALSRSKNESLFIKPTEIKLFTGFVLDKSLYSCLNGLPGNTQLLAYKPFDYEIKTEWRAYIKDHKLLDIKNYSGDFTVMPDIEYVKSIIQENKKDFPIAYTIDVGVLSSDENVVIEFNDGWAIGNYGVPNSIYISFLRARYYEIVT